MVFFRKINVFLFLNITFPLGHIQNVFGNSFPIQRLVERFRETGSIGEKRRSGRPSVLSNDTLEDIRARLLQALRKSLKNFPYKLE
jgi:transposase